MDRQCWTRRGVGDVRAGSGLHRARELPGGSRRRVSPVAGRDDQRDRQPAPLVRLQVEDGPLHLARGDRRSLSVWGDYADEVNVLLPASYVTFFSTDPSVAAVSAAGQLVARAAGTSTLVVSSHGIQTANAVAVGFPTLALDRFLHVLGMEVDPNAVTLPTGGTRQLLVTAAGRDELDCDGRGDGVLRRQSRDCLGGCQWTRPCRGDGSDGGHHRSRSGAGGLSGACRGACRWPARAGHGRWCRARRGRFDGGTSARVRCRRRRK